MKNRTYALQFSKSVRMGILQRDNGCLYCKLMYRMDKAKHNELTIFDCMHIVNKSQGGMGVIENGVQGCRYHHNLLDNSEYNQEMREMARNYLRSLYPGWTEESVTYNKYKDLVVYRKRGSYGNR